LCGGCFVMSLLCVAAATCPSFLPLYLPLPFLLENAMTTFLTYRGPVLHMVSWSLVQSSHEWTGTVQRPVFSTCSGLEVWLGQMNSLSNVPPHTSQFEEWLNSHCLQISHCNIKRSTSVANLLGSGGRGLVYWKREGGWRLCPACDEGVVSIS